MLDEEEKIRLRKILQKRNTKTSAADLAKEYNVSTATMRKALLSNEILSDGSWALIALAQSRLDRVQP